MKNRLVCKEVAGYIWVGYQHNRGGSIGAPDGEVAHGHAYSTIPIWEGKGERAGRGQDKCFGRGWGER